MEICEHMEVVDANRDDESLECSDDAIHSFLPRF